MLKSKTPWRRVASLVVPLPAQRSWYQVPQKKCKSWSAPLVWQQSGREQLPDACCYFCLCCWHRGSYGLFTGSCFVSALTCPGSAVSTGTFAPCVDGHTVHRQMLDTVRLVLIEATLLGFVQELVPHYWVCPRNCLFVLKQEAARPASSSAFTFACEPEMLFISW